MIVERSGKTALSYGLRGWTCSTLFGLIAVTGLRVNEASGSMRETSISMKPWSQ